MARTRGVTGKKRAKWIANVRRLIGKNYTDDEICQTIGIQSRTLLSLKTEILNFDKTFFEHMDSGSVFSEYILKARQNLVDLDRLIKHTRIRSAQGSEKTAFVAAIKLRAEINEKVVKMGQDLGHIDKRAKEIDLNIEGAIDHNFSTKSNAEIKKEIDDEVAKLHQLASGHVTIEMREELLGVSGEEVRKFLPSKIVKSVPGRKKKRKVRLRKNV